MRTPIPVSRCGVTVGTNPRGRRMPRSTLPSGTALWGGGPPTGLARGDVHPALASPGLRERVRGLSLATGFDPQRPLVGDAHHLVRAAARDLLTDGQRTEARVAALDAAAASGIVAVHECAGPEIGGLDDWHELRTLSARHGVQVTGYWGQAVTSAAQARAGIEATGAAGLAGDLFGDGALGSRTAWLHEPYTDAADRVGTCYLDSE